MIDFVNNTTPIGKTHNQLSDFITNKPPLKDYFLEKALGRQRNSLMKSTLRKNLIRKYVSTNFKINLKIEKLIANKIELAEGTFLTIFKSFDGKLYGLLTAKNNLDLIDVKKIVKTSGIDTANYIPPQGDINYFIEYGRQRYQKHFPGKVKISTKDTEFYQTLAPYNPALFSINKIGDGVKAVDPITGKYDKKLDYTFQKIRVKFL